MREIKFRAWDFSRDEMMYGDAHNILQWNDHKYCMQYTGLKDKNGREIYEGDVIKFDDQNIGFIDCEDWTEFFVHWIGNPDCTDYARDFYRIGRAEVIGNIYENPELLK